MVSNRRRNVLHTASTGDLPLRVCGHKAGARPGFATRYNLTDLVYYERCPDADAAAAREKQIRGWTRAKKNALVATMNPDWRDLSAEVLRS